MQGLLTEIPGHFWWRRGLPGAWLEQHGEAFRQHLRCDGVIRSPGEGPEVPGVASGELKELIKSSIREGEAGMGFFGLMCEEEASS
jgi:hypothetical protein